MRNFSIFYRTFLVCSVIGFVIDFFFNGFQIVLIDVILDCVMNLLFGAISVYICGEFARSMDMDDALKFLKENCINVIERDDVIVGRLSKYKEFYMGNIQYDKVRRVMTGSKVIVKKRN